MARLLRIEPILARHPRTFSGGEQQRVAIGRAIAHPSALLMLDEPLTNLDARIRIALRIEFKSLHRETQQSMLYVTHDHVEAMSLSDRIAVLDHGRLQQIGTPDDIYHRPINRFVAEFVGSPPMNFSPPSWSETAAHLKRGATASVFRSAPTASSAVDACRDPSRSACGRKPSRPQLRRPQ